MGRFLILILLAALSVFAAPASGQSRLTGTVSDAVTGEALPGATVQIVGTYTGTVANAAGHFALGIPSLPAELDVRFIGYHTARIRVTAVDNPLSVRLEPSAIEMRTITISSEDPAMEIMRQVIARKQEWRAGLQTYAVDAYNRFRMENDTGIVSIWESFTRAYWDKDRGVREVSIWQETTDNVPMDDLLPAAMLVVNLYDDDVEVAGHRLMGVTHPDALDLYRFRLDSLRSVDDRTVYDIAVEPRTRRGSGFVGRISVLDGEWAMVDASLRPGEAFLFPPPVDYLKVSYRQQFSRFSGTVWLPVDLVTEMDLKVSLGPLLTFPVFRIRQLSRLSDFELNGALPDSLYASDDVVVASAERMETRPADLVSVPLTPRERAAYATIDSTMTMDKAFAPGGLAGRMARMDDGRDRSERQLPGALSRLSVRPDIWYNRVEGAHLGGGLSARLPGGVRVAVRAGWAEAPGRLTRGASITRKGRWSAQAGWMDGIAIRNESRMRGQLLNSAGVAIGGTDYFDYVDRSGWDMSVSRRLDRWSVTAAFTAFDYAPVVQELGSTFLGATAEVTPNLAVPTGSLRTAGLQVERSWDRSPFAIGPDRRVMLSVERGVGGSLDTGHVRADVDAWWRFPTFNRRRLLPQALDVRLVAGAMSDAAPIVRMGLIDGSGKATVFGGLRTRQGRPYEGTRYGLLVWEHTFRTVPFEWLGLDGLVRRHWSFIAHGGMGRSWVPTGHPAAARDSHGVHHEAGISLSGILTVVRLDATWRLDRPGFTPGLSVSRLF